MKRRLSTTLLTLLCIAMSGTAQVRLPQLFQNGMVVQRNKPTVIWGDAQPGQQIGIRLHKQKTMVTADADGHFRATLAPQKAGGPYQLTIGTMVINDVMIGDVWLCAGQSNMDVTIERVYPQYPDEIDHYENSKIRYFRVQTDKDTHAPKADVLPTSWKPLTQANVKGFSAISYFLAKRMFEQTGVAQGVICNSLGGTPVEAWISADSLLSEFPIMVQKTMLYDNPEMVAAQDKANNMANNRWSELLDKSDKGMAEGWNSEAYNDKDWRTVNQYSTLTQGYHGNYRGSLWLRQHLNIDSKHAGKAARLLVGTLFDMDYTFVNGREVGRTYYQYPPRRYQIPTGLLHKGDNVLSIRFISKYGIPHFIHEKPYMLIFEDGDTLRLSEQWKVQEGALMTTCPSGGTSIQNLPSVLYNAMLYPLAPYTINGVVWYQGESNTGANDGWVEDNGPAVYGKLLKKMMGNWRALWNNEQLPFCIVQLANFMAPSEQPQPRSAWARLREAQRLVAINDPFAELAVAIDMGETVDIHPLRKKEVADRVGACMDHLVYGKKAWLSPQPVKATANERQVTVSFNQPMLSGEQPEFEVCDASGRFVNAKATCDGSTVTIESPVANPVRVRYAFKDNPLKARLQSAKAVPASPFEIAIEH